MSELNEPAQPAPEEPRDAPLPWRFAAIVGLIGLAAVLGFPHLFPGELGFNLSLACCGGAAYLGITTPIPEFLRGRKQLASMSAVVLGGLTVQLLVEIRLLEGWRQMFTWGMLYVLCFLTGKPLTTPQKREEL